MAAPAENGRLEPIKVEKQRVACAESGALNLVRTPFLSGCSRLLRYGKDRGQFAEVQGCGGDEEFVICTAWNM